MAKCSTVVGCLRPHQRQWRLRRNRAAKVSLPGNRKVTTLAARGKSGDVVD